MTDKLVKSLLNYLDISPTSFQAAQATADILTANDFTCLSETESWKLKENGKYYVVRNHSAIIAFIIGSESPVKNGFHIAASHLDSPCLKIKPESVSSCGNVVRIGVEVYGSPIIATWLDRELGIAGKVMVKESLQPNAKYKPVPVNINRPIAIIPNAAIHLNRDINNGFEYNKQNHLQAILQIKNTEGDNTAINLLIAQELKVKPEQIGSVDLFLYDINKAALVGVNKEFIVSGRLDNLAMSHAILSALIAINKPKATAMGVFYDNEEIGSQTLQGADSGFLSDVLERIILANQVTQEDKCIALRKSFLISADMAHALHPNYSEKHDPYYQPVMNGGTVIKLNANYRYATSSESAQYFIDLCQSVNASYQKFIMRSDAPCGSTIGPVTSAKLSIPTVDIGNPMWAMHSIRETSAVKDHLNLIKILSKFLG